MICTLTCSLKRYRKFWLEVVTLVKGSLMLTGHIKQMDSDHWKFERRSLNSVIAQKNPKSFHGYPLRTCNAFRGCFMKGTSCSYPDTAIRKWEISSLLMFILSVRGFFLKCKIWNSSQFIVVLPKKTMGLTVSIIMMLATMRRHWWKLSKNSWR